jgi:hypothetical protein
MASALGGVVRLVLRRHVITGLELAPGSHLTYGCAFMPEEGETASSLTEHHPAGFGSLMAMDEAGDLLLDGEAMDEFTSADASPDRAAARASLRSQAITPLLE